MRRRWQDWRRCYPTWRWGLESNIPRKTKEFLMQFQKTIFGKGQLISPPLHTALTSSNLMMPTFIVGRRHTGRRGQGKVDSLLMNNLLQDFMLHVEACEDDEERQHGLVCWKKRLGCHVSFGRWGTVILRQLEVYCTEVSGRREGLELAKEEKKNRDLPDCFNWFTNFRLLQINHKT